MAAAPLLPGGALRPARLRLYPGSCAGRGVASLRVLPPVCGPPATSAPLRGGGGGSPARAAVEKGGEGKVRVQPLFCPPRKYIPPRCRQALGGEERSGLRLGVGSEGRALRGQRGPGPAACAGGGCDARRAAHVVPHHAVRVRGTGKAPPGAALRGAPVSPLPPATPRGSRHRLIWWGSISAPAPAPVELLPSGRRLSQPRNLRAGGPLVPTLRPCAASQVGGRHRRGVGVTSRATGIVQLPRPVAPASWYSARAHVLLRFLKDSCFGGQNIKEV